MRSSRIILSAAVGVLSAASFLGFKNHGRFNQGNLFTNTTGFCRPAFPFNFCHTNQIGFGRPCLIGITAYTTANCRTGHAWTKTKPTRVVGL